ncbi:NepR family anti-sigma factor [Aureimonas sp. AU40]|uniref:NepR family anti-sigma factor n=1 Tax=Aureimonas sp. AU40 TaxID=1637747 RepID=UPI0007842928|nr:NepR family anti-sigma factor [Aureimonas sp. AU40]
MEDRDNREGAQSQPDTMPAPGGSTDLGSSSAIGKRLKAYYDDVASEPVPDRFLSLLDALDAAESASKTPKQG